MGTAIVSISPGCTQSICVTGNHTGRIVSHIVYRDNVGGITATVCRIEASDCENRRKVRGLNIGRTSDAGTAGKSMIPTLLSGLLPRITGTAKPCDNKDDGPPSARNSPFYRVHGFPRHCQKCGDKWLIVRNPTFDAISFKCRLMTSAYSTNASAVVALPSRLHLAKPAADPNGKGDFTAQCCVPTTHRPVGCRSRDRRLSAPRPAGGGAHVTEIENGMHPDRAQPSTHTSSS